MIKQALMGAAIVAASLAGFSHAAEAPAAGEADTSVIKTVKSLPINGLKMVESSDGQIIFVSDDARFVFKGEVFDRWNKVAIETPADVDNYATRVNLEAINLDVDELMTLTYGTGETVLNVFVDPRCPYCHKTMDQMKDLEDEYTFKLILIPVLGKESQDIVASIHCAAEGRESEMLRRLMDQDFEGLETPHASCNKERLQKTYLAAKMLGVHGVPYMITADGRVGRGYTPNLKAFIEGTK